MVKDTYMVQTRSQVKAKAANAPAVQSTTGKPVTQNTIPKIDRIPIRTDKNSKPNRNTQTQPLLNTVVSQQLPQGLVVLEIKFQSAHIQVLDCPQNLQILSIKRQLQAQI